MVTYSLRWSRQSKFDLKEIFDYITSVESKERALYVITELRKTAQNATIFPKKHRKEELFDGNIRYVLKWRYKILFTIHETSITIVRIFHTAQNPAKLIDTPIFVP